MGFPSEDEARMAHVIAYNYAEPQHQSKIGAPRMNDNGCNFSHRPTSHCDSCRWNECQECGQNLMASFTGWTGLCIHHSHMLYKVRNIPDGSDGFYIKDDSSNGTTAPSSSTGAAAPTAAPSGASSSSASIGQSSSAASIGQSISAASIGPSTGASQSGGTPQTKPNGGGGSSKGKNRAVMPSGGPLMASSLPQSSPGGASSATPSDAGGGSYAGGGIVIKPDPDAIVISSEDESPEAATIREIRKLYPGYPGHYDPPGQSESVYKVAEILICTGSTPNKQAYTKEVHDVFLMLDNGIEKSATYKKDPPYGFNRHVSSFKVVEILRIQHYGQEQKFLIAEQMAKARNQERPADERVPDDKIVTLFMHGTTVENAKKVVKDNIRQCRNSMHRFGKGLYATAGIMSTAVSYAFGRYDDDPAIFICDFIVGRAAKTDGQDLTDVPPTGFDSIGSGDDWVLVATDQDALRFKYIVAIERATDDYDFQRQLKDIKDRYTKMLEEEETAKAKKTLSAPVAGAMDLSGLMASVDADEPPTMDPSDGGSSSVQLATGGPPNKKSTKPKTASAGGPSKPPTKRSAASAGGPPNKKSTKSADPGGPSTAKTSAKRNDPSSRKFVVNTNGMSASISITGGASVTVTNGNQSSTAGAGVKKPKRTYPTKTLSKNTRVKFMVGSSGGSGSSGGAGDPDGGADAGGSTQEEEEEPKYKTTPEDTTEEEESDDSDDSDWA